MVGSPHKWSVIDRPGMEVLIICRDVGTLKCLACWNHNMDKWWVLLTNGQLLIDQGRRFLLSAGMLVHWSAWHAEIITWINGGFPSQWSVIDRPGTEVLIICRDVGTLKCLACWNHNMDKWWVPLTNGQLLIDQGRRFLLSAGMLVHWSAWHAEIITWINGGFPSQMVSYW